MSKRNHKRRIEKNEQNGSMAREAMIRDDEAINEDSSDDGETYANDDWETFINGGDDSVVEESETEDVEDAVIPGSEIDDTENAVILNPEDSDAEGVADLNPEDSDAEGTVNLNPEDSDAEGTVDLNPAKAVRDETEYEASANDKKVSKPQKKRAESSNNSDVEKAQIRREAARVAKDRHDREKNKASVEINKTDERREARHKRRVRNQVVAYLSIIVFVLLIIACAFFVYVRFFRNNETPQQIDGTITVSDASEQTEDIISDMLGMEDDISEPVQNEVVEEVLPEEPEADLLGEYVSGVINNMTLEEKVASLFIITPEALTGTTTATAAGDMTRTALAKYTVGGIVYSNKNINTKDQFTTMIGNTLTMVKYPTFMAIEEEGGTVSPLAKAGFYAEEESPAHIAASDEVSGAYGAGVSIGFAMHEIGLNLDFAPVADLTIVEGNPLGTRSYSDTAGSAVGYVVSMMQGIEDAKVTSCLKYFPGLGMVTEDPANGRVVSDRSDEDFSEGELLVYKTAIDNGANMIMMSNVIYSAYSDVPATVSNDVVSGILRERLGYNGIIISAKLSDAAISQYYSSEEASIAALKAGCDMILCPENFVEAYDGVLKAVGDGVISEARINDALERVLRVKYADNYEQ